MDFQERQNLADERAEQYAPKPTGGVLMAGLCGAVVGLLADVCVSRFYRWRVADHLLITALVAVVGGVEANSMTVEVERSGDEQRSILDDQAAGR